MATCHYEGCPEAAYSNSEWCTLHLDFPSDDDREFAATKAEKQKRTQEKIAAGDWNFEGAKIYDIRAADVKIPASDRVSFKNATIKGDALFGGATINGSAWFNGATIEGTALFGGATIKVSVWFGGAIINGSAWFDGATIGEDAWFDGATIGASALFDGATIGGSAYFSGATIGEDALFDGAIIKGSAYFGAAKIGRNAQFNLISLSGKADFKSVIVGGESLLQSAMIRSDVLFTGAKLSNRVSLTGTSVGGIASFNKADIGCGSAFDVASVSGALTFSDTHFVCLNVKEAGCGALRKKKRFYEPITRKCIWNVRLACLEAAEAAYRAAKKNCNDRGATAKADDYFYKEMVARRKRKKQPIKSLELLIQYGLGYGARPSWLFGWWILIAFAGAIALALATSQWQNIGFGFAAAFVPGYGITRAQSGIAEWVAALITVVNFFLWAAFIAVFSRRYID